MNVRTRIAAATCVLAAGVGPAACTSGTSDAGDGKNGSAPSASPVAGTEVVRWWSNSAAGKGSTIDPARPDAAAGKLHRSRAEYCGMLRQTVNSGRQVLPDVTATDPALLTASRAFVGELRAVAPQPVATSWKPLGDAVLKLAASKGDASKVRGVDAAAVRRAVTAVATDAKRSCRLDLGG